MVISSLKPSRTWHKCPKALLIYSILPQFKAINTATKKAHKADYDKISSLQIISLPYVTVQNIDTSYAKNYTFH